MSYDTWKLDNGETIDVARDDAIEAIEADSLLFDACEAYDLARVDCDPAVCEIESGGWNWAKTNISIAVEAENVAENRERLAEVFRYLADKLEGQS